MPTAQPPEGDGLVAGTLGLPAALIDVETPICIRATTQDGRYFSENTFAARGALPESGRADLDWPTDYADALQRIPLREVAVVARRQSCTDAAQIIPVILGSGSELRSLQVFINTRGETITAAVRDPDTHKTLKRVNCARVDGSARVAFDARCVLGPASDFPHLTQLRLEEVSRDGLETEVLENVTLRLSN